MKPVKTSGRPPLKAFSFILAFGWISLLGDFVYEGARSITGPLLASLGASAAAVGLITGAGEAAALLLRLVSGPLADRTRRFWTLAIAGYVLTAVSVPLLGFAGVLWVTAALVITERVGKAVRSPAKDTMLSHAASAVGRGKGFAIQEAMDQAGAVVGPLTVAGMLALTGNSYGPSLLVLAVPGVGMVAILLWLRRRVPAPETYEVAPVEAAPPEGPRPPDDPGRHRPALPAAFWQYAAFTALTVSGIATFGVLSFHMVSRGIIPAPAVPVVYAAVMGIDALAALASGWLYDRFGAVALGVLPILAAVVPVLAFRASAAPVIAGSLLWGCAMGVQESTMRATVADLVAPIRRATAYGIFAAVVGCAALAGGVLAGVLYQVSIPALIATTAVIQLVALLLLVPLLIKTRQKTKKATGSRE
ncbi:MAG: MFS transporter [Actinomycetota bacterium]|nr:MFS transporter [Actinomycetota bacterium]